MSGKLPQGSGQRTCPTRCPSDTVVSQVPSCWVAGMLFASQFSCISSRVFCFFLDATWFMIPSGVVTSVSLKPLILFRFSSKMYEYQLLSKEFYFVQYIDIKTKCLFKPVTIAVEPKPWNDHRCWAMHICQGRLCNTVETERKEKQCGDRGLGPESLWML